MNSTVVDAWFGAFRQKDIEALESLLSEDFAHFSPFGVIEPRHAYIDLVKTNPDAFFNPVIEVQDIFESGEKVAVRYLINGNPACDCIYTSGGQVTKIFSYYHFGEKPSM